ncbi:hypothetical protein Nepgr_020543 [Nepenthes gracilis]|uniref:Glycosyltransferase 61 catalytic domain-containing protein n=1 Tax=Nepenthes gracilis TaxID=150966 RepID=A0AAD3XV58_NEPGR|nr:hypothetical protein Nepgr_020543 [Nepenthes gracilis]
MAHHQRYYHQLRKGEEKAGALMEGNGDESQATAAFVRENTKGFYHFKRGRPGLLFILLFSLLFCCLIWDSRLLGFRPSFSLLYSFRAEDEEMGSQLGSNTPICSSISDGTICCDRSSLRSDICFMKGDIRTNSPSSSVFLYTKQNPKSSVDHLHSFVEVGKEHDDQNQLQIEKIKPYTRKWETSIMNTIQELNLISNNKNLGLHCNCDVWHDVPAIVFSTGGYTGNVYHEFNDGILPLYITSQHFNKKVVFVILEYHNWWFTKYREIISLLSNYSPIDFNGDKRTHCFREAIVGLRIHDELTVDSSLMGGNKTIRDFRDLLDRAYRPRISDLVQEERREVQLKIQDQPSSSRSTLTASIESGERVRDDQPKKPKLIILSRNGSRSIKNEDLLVKLGEEIGFQVEVMKPDRTTELAKIYRALNSSDAMIGVHGAAMTHFLFLNPGCVFVQVIPLGTGWAAETYYGEPALKLGLRYIPYKILPRESSLSEEYNRNDPVLRNPEGVGKKGWQFTKKIYLDNQIVKLDLRRFKKRLVLAYEYSIARRNGQLEL